MVKESGKRKQKIKWSKLYTFSCFRPKSADTETTQQILGQPGFSRVVFCNEPQLHKVKPYKYPTNYVSTTKYNFASFLPKALFKQFCRVANLYFLLAAALSLPSLAPFNPATLIAPLVFVVGISMLKEAMEDWCRFLQDMNVNSRKMKVHQGNGIFMNKTWKELSVGHILKVNKNEYFPSDLLLLSSSYRDGVCDVEAMNLDGETNLKFKGSLEVTLGLDEDAEFSKFEATIRYSESDKRWYLCLQEDVEASFNPSNPAWSFCLQFVRALILYGYLIPISLCVSIEVVKVLQAMFINNDLRMYDELTRQLKPQCQT